MEAFAEHELGFFEAHRNGSCNESKTDMLAGAAILCKSFADADLFKITKNRNI